MPDCRRAGLSNRSLTVKNSLKNTENDRHRDATESRGSDKCLVNSVDHIHLYDDMNCWISRRIITCLLGIALSVGLTLSAVQASNMTVDKAIAGEMTPSGSGDCDGCGSEDTANFSSCHSVCASTNFVGPMPEKFARQSEPGQPVRVDSTPLHSTAFSPDPHPPRPTFPI